MKKQLLAIIIAAGISGCAGHTGYGSYESDAHYSARMGLIGAYLNRPQYQIPLPRRSINVYQNYYRRW